MKATAALAALILFAPVVVAAADEAYDHHHPDLYGRRIITNGFEAALTSGTSAVRITNGTAQITVSGDSFAPTYTIQLHALVQAAEETLAKGYDLFRFSPDGTWAGPHRYGYSTRYSYLGPAISMPRVKWGRPLTITMIKGPTPARMPDGEFEARDVLKRLGASNRFKYNEPVGVPDYTERP